MFVECGPNFTCKLEGMFKDIELSKEMMGPFKQVLYYKVINTIYMCMYMYMYVNTL